MRDACNIDKAFGGSLEIFSNRSSDCLDNELYLCSFLFYFIFHVKVESPKLLIFFSLFNPDGFLAESYRKRNIIWSPWRVSSFCYLNKKTCAKRMIYINWDNKTLIYVVLIGCNKVNMRGHS